MYTKKEGPFGPSLFPSPRRFNSFRKELELSLVLKFAMFGGGGSFEATHPFHFPSYFDFRC